MNYIQVVHGEVGSQYSLCQCRLRPLFGHLQITGVCSVLVCVTRA